MMDYSNQITFVIFTFNEAKRIERVLRNFAAFGRILVVDNESTDTTLDIARKYQCEILTNKNSGWVEDEVTVSRVKAAVKTEWIYWGFADEMLERATIEAILTNIKSGKYDVVSVARKNYYYGSFCHDLFADRLNRVFKKDAIDFTGNLLHGFGRVAADARISELPPDQFVHHFISNTAKSYLQVMDRYTDMESAEDRGTPSLKSLIVASVKMMVSNLLLRRGLRGGMPSGFLMSNMIYYHWLSAMKRYEQHARLNRDAIEKLNDEVRDRILSALP